MRRLIAIPLSLILIGIVALPSIAGRTSVTNKHRYRRIFNGKSKTKVDVTEVYEGTRKADTFSSQREWGSTVVTEANNGRKFRETDRFDIRADSTSGERGKVLRTTDITFRESYDFSGFSRSHRVTTQFEF